MNNVILSAENLNKSYHDGELSVSVLKNINVNVQKGERVAIIGSSGSGKSTLLHLLGGLDVPSSGHVSLMQHRFSALSEAKRSHLRNAHLGFVYQFHHLLPEFTVLDNVAMPLLVKRINIQQARAEAALLLKQVGLDHRLMHKPMELSGGERQRTAIARALITKPDCLLADEPTGNLDSGNAEQVYELLLSLQEMHGMAMVIVTHDMTLASKMTRILHMRDGSFVDESRATLAV